MEDIASGLEGVVVAATRLSEVDGERGRLIIGGYPVEELAPHAHFEEVLFLLWHGRLPSPAERAALAETLAARRALPEATQVLLHDAARRGVPAMDALRMGVATLSLGGFGGGDREAALDDAATLVAALPTVIATYWRHREGRALPRLRRDLGHVAHALWLLEGREPDPAVVRALETYCNTVVDHGMNASTFTARVIASTQSDLCSAVVGAIGALKGPLHGGANERVLEVLKEVQKMGDAEAWVREALAKKRRIMGFGHRVYKNGDPRAVILRGYCRELAEESGDMEMEEIADTIERIVRTEKGLPPNLDWPSARLYHAMGLEPEVFTPLFVVSRVVGWAAHVLEQSESNRLIRPRSRYNGPAKRKFVPLAQRD